MRAHKLAPDCTHTLSQPANLSINRTEPVREFRDFLQIDTGIGHLHWLMQHNGGVFLPPWGKIEQWLLSVQHDDADVDRFAANFARMAKAVAG
jgi:glutamate-1-semialdehyde 2,1-aminomutase